jgi:hypothetical protein
MNKSHQHHDIVVSGHFKNPADALIDSARIASKQFSTGKQAVHIIFVNLILQDKKWQAITSITAIDDIDGDGKPAIIFGHLPEKYEDYYDDLLPEVDHLNVIHNYAVWRDIKKHLLDLHFYQAVHYGAIQRMSDSKGEGYFKEKKEKFKTEDSFTPDFEEIPNDAQSTIDGSGLSFQERAEILAQESYNEEYEVLLRNQREGRRYKNLIVK